MKTVDECKQVSEKAAREDYFCPDKFHIAKPEARHAGVYECRDKGNPANFDRAYIQSKKNSHNRFYGIDIAKFYGTFANTETHSLF